MLAAGIAALVCAITVAVGAASAAPSGPPIRIGSTLALTGPLASTALVHQLVGEIYVEQINKKNGMLGRPVEWIVKDDQSKPDLARTLYEQLITVDKVDLLMGPYATGAILSAMGVAQRYNKILVHHTFGIPSLAKYDAHFPTWSLGADPAATFPNTLLDALAATPKPPKTIAVVTSKFPSVHFMSLGAREAAKKRGLQEVVFLEWDFGNRDFGAIAGAGEGCQSRFRLGRRDRARGQPAARRDEEDRLRAAAALPHVPGAGPDGAGARRQECARGDDLRGASPVPQQSGRGRVREALQRARRQGRASLHRGRNAGRGVVLGVAGARCGGHRDEEPRRQGARRLAAEEQVDTIQGKLRFDGPSNYGDDLWREAGAERPLGHRLAEERRGAGRDADDEVTPSRAHDGASRAFRSSRSRCCRGSSSAPCTGSWASGLSLSWGLLRQINLAHFALAFLAAYLCYQLSTVGGVDPLLTLAVIVPGFFALGVAMQWLLRPLRDQRLQLAARHVRVDGHRRVADPVDLDGGLPAARVGVRQRQVQARLPLRSRAGAPDARRSR